MPRLLLLSLFYVLLILCSGCAFIFKGVKRTKNVEYAVTNDSIVTSQRHRLDIYAPKGTHDSLDVLIFIHGGNWNSGSKKTYRFLGNRFARKGVVLVVINYRLSPGSQYNDMALDAAMSVKWVYEHIQNYGGNPQSIYVSGHSAGGHLAALIALDDSYFESINLTNPLKGAILIDAAGLDMYSYLKEQKFEEGKTYLKVFSNDPEIWKLASPIYYLKDEMIPLLIYRGGKTYPSIIKSNEAFLVASERFTDQAHYKVQKRKRHIPMIVQFLYTPNPRYDEILKFMENPEDFSF